MRCASLNLCRSLIFLSVVTEESSFYTKYRYGRVCRSDTCQPIRCDGIRDNRLIQLYGRVSIMLAGNRYQRRTFAVCEMEIIHVGMIFLWSYRNLFQDCGHVKMDIAVFLSLLARGPST